MLDLLALTASSAVQQGFSFVVPLVTVSAGDGLGGRHTYEVSVPGDLRLRVDGRPCSPSPSRCAFPPDGTVVVVTAGQAVVGRWTP